MKSSAVQVAAMREILGTGGKTASQVIDALNGPRNATTGQPEAPTPDS